MAVKHSSKDFPIGQRFGRLVVIGFSFIPYTGRKRDSKVFCLCDCGNIKVVTVNKVRSLHTRSCGCIYKEGNNKKHGFSKAHSGGATGIYRVWSNMISRCYNKNVPSYKHYGGRGISVCDEWRKNSGSFIKWALLNGWKRWLHVDRINNNLGYSPENCHFVTRTLNARNRRNNVLLTAFGETKCITAWSDDPRCQVGPRTIEARIRRGWKDEKSITHPLMRSRRVVGEQ